MALQPRAEATRQAIIETAVDLFTSAGYSNVVIADIVNKAVITKGAFYYHFPTKAHLVETIHRTAYRNFSTAIQPLLAIPMASLERLIRISFIAADLVVNDRYVRLSSELRQAGDHANRVDVIPHAGDAAAGEALVSAAIAEGDVKESCDPHVVMGAVRVGVLGAIMASSETGESVYLGVVLLWRTLLPGIVADESLPFFLRLVDGMERHYCL